MRKLLPVLYLSLSALILSLCPNKARADHSAGGEIIYEWISDSTYRFIFKFYKDCAGITSEPTQATLCYYNSCNTISGSLPLPKLLTLPNGMPNGSEVSNGCPGYNTRCNGGTLPGYREYWYVDTMTLPARCNYWTFYVSISARNPSANIGGGTLYIETTLNNLDVQSNSSPYFSVKPVPFVCINSPYTYNNGVVDPNSDSVSFEFINPRTASTVCATSYNATNLNFTGTFSLTEPFATGGTFLFDPATGQMSFTPTVVSANTVTVRVNEWRNGIKIGSVMRDVQVRVLSCNSVQPTLSLVTGSITGASYVNGRVEGCANNPLSFCYNASSSVAGAILVASDNHTSAAPGSTVTYTGQATSSVTGCISWTPSSADTGLRIYTVTVKDSTCTPPGVLISQTFVIPIYIRPAMKSVRSTIICPGEQVQLVANGSGSINWSVLPGGSPLSTLSCTNCQFPVALPDISTTYIATSVTANGCDNTDTVNITVDRDNIVLVSPSSPIVACDPELVQLNATTTGPKPLRNLPCGIADVIPPTPQTSRDLIPFSAVLQNSYTSNASPISGNSKTARHQYLLHAADLKSAGMYSGTIRNIAFRFLSNSNSSALNNLRIGLKCTTKEALDPADGFESGTVPVYSGGSVGVPSYGGYIGVDLNIPYNWDTTKNLIVDVCYQSATSVQPSFTYFYNTSYTSTLYAAAASGDICNGTPAAISGIGELPLIRLTYHLAPEADFVYKWSNGVFTPSANVPNPAVYVSEERPIYVTTYNRNGCAIVDTIDLYVPNFQLLTRDTNICEGTVLMLDARNGTSYQWYENGFNAPASLSCTNCANPYATPPAGTINYTVVIGDNHGCDDTLSVQIQVTPYPNLLVSPEDTIIKYGQSVQLNASGADSYSWTPVGSLNNASLQNPLALPYESTDYIVTGYPSANGNCYRKDTIHVIVDFKDNLFVPSAFSPNGDGRNDIFKVVNLTFQKLQEFRVFNRWGQELFATNDPRKGWDGTWSGKPQDIGVYKYLIRVSIPDGTVQTYKGDVTLTR